MFDSDQKVRDSRIPGTFHLQESSFLEHIYRHRFEVEYRELSFLLRLVWHYRTVESEQEMADFGRDAAFYRQFGHLLLEKGVIPGYQGSFF